MKHSIVHSVTIMLVAGAGVAGAQVGYPPARSPYLDLEHTQEFTIIVGQFHGHRDPAGVAPQGGLAVGAHYEWRAGGPAHLVAEVVRIQSDSRVLNPFRSGAARDVGLQTRPLYAADFNLGLNVTGAKSWHGLVPEVGGGLGIIRAGAKADTGGFDFGTRFSLNTVAGLKYVPGGSWQIRADIKDRLYTISYPESYYVAPTGGSAIIPPTQAKSFWTNNPTLSIGISRLF